MIIFGHLVSVSLVHLYKDCFFICRANSRMYSYFFYDILILVYAKADVCKTFFFKRAMWSTLTNYQNNLVLEERKWRANINRTIRCSHNNQVQDSITTSSLWFPSITVSYLSSGYYYSYSFWLNDLEIKFRFECLQTKTEKLTN